MTARKKITFFMDALHGGGAEKAVVNLLKGLAELDEFDLDLVLAKLAGPYLDQVPKSVRVINLGTGRVVTAIPSLANYLKKNRPWALIGNMGHVNVGATLAKELSGIKTHLVLVEQNTISASTSTLKRAKLVKLLMSWLYPRASAVAGVSAGVARDLEQQLGLPHKSVKVLNNPVVNADLISRRQEPADHPWLADKSVPVFLAIGRLNRQKDFPNLINAFAQVRKQRSAKLIILGKGDERPMLEQLIDERDLKEDVMLPGFVTNPYAYLSQASCFVLSSRQEGLPTVLIEALACGCPVVATDCPSGPDEILDHGTYGTLVPIENSPALAEAMFKTLDNHVAPETLMERASEYSTGKVVTAYLKLLATL